MRHTIVKIYNYQSIFDTFILHAHYATQPCINLFTCMFISLLLISSLSLCPAVSLISVLGTTFRGFIVQARDVNGSVIGMMDTSASGDQARLADCPDSNNATVS